MDNPCKEIRSKELELAWPKRAVNACVQHNDLSTLNGMLMCLPVDELSPELLLVWLEETLVYKDQLPYRSVFANLVIKRLSRLTLMMSELEYLL